MTRRFPLWRAIATAICLIAVLFTPAISGLAATITATVTDDFGRPLPDAVVTVIPEPGTTPVRIENSRIATATIDQKDEAFVPATVVIRTGGTVIFRNSDRIRHHLYSFTPIRRFETVQTPGETSSPIVFDQAGSVAVGCNIHDHMTAHILVTDAPWAMATNAMGLAVLPDLPAGRFVATVWHPRLRPKAEAPTQKITLATENSNLAITLPVLPPKRVRGRDY